MKKLDELELMTHVKEISFHKSHVIKLIKTIRAQHKALKFYANNENIECIVVSP